MPVRIPLSAALAATALAATVTAIGAERKHPIAVEDLYAFDRISQLALAPDHELAAFVAAEYEMEKNSSTSHLWLVDLRSNDVDRLTNARASDWSPRWLPDGRLAFLSARSGKTQVWAIDPRGGEAERITDLPTGVDRFLPSPRSDHLALVARVHPECGADMECNAKRAAEEKKDPVDARVIDHLLYRHWDTWLDDRRGHVLWFSLENGEIRDLTPGEIQTPPLSLGAGDDLAISPDGTEVAFTANTTDNPAWNTDNDVLTVAVAGGEPRVITADNDACDAGPIYSPDGEYMAYLAMERPGFESDRRVLTLYDRESKKRIRVSDSLDRSVRSFSWAPDSETIFFTAPNRGRVSIYKTSIPSGIVTELISEGSNGDVLVSRDGERLYYLKQSISRPAELFTATTAGAGEKQISHLNDELVDSIEWGQWEDIEIEGADGQEIHGFLLHPPGFEPKGKTPLLMLIHGGPQGAFGDGFHYRWNMQMFASPGFAVAAVNFHGSRGYGQDFCDAVSKDWGGKPYRDIMNAVDQLTEERDYLDSDNVSAAGASYGGFMINWILGHTDRFRSLVSHDGVFEQFSMYGATEELWFPEWEMGGTPYEAPELYDEFSPARYADEFSTPTLVVHGEHDYRVPYTQGLQLFTALQRRGVESKLLFYPDENHFVQKPKNAGLWWHTVLGWLADHAGLRWSPPGREPVKKPRRGKRRKLAR
ncbi:MAG: S9 family peptidase [Polyangia bacterium]